MSYTEKLVEKIFRLFRLAMNSFQLLSRSIIRTKSTADDSFEPTCVIDADYKSTIKLLVEVFQRRYHSLDLQTKRS